MLVLISQRPFLQREPKSVRLKGAILPQPLHAPTHFLYRKTNCRNSAETEVLSAGMLC